MIIWARCVSPQVTRWCAIKSVGDSVLTWCRVRWDAREPNDIHASEPDKTERCIRCEIEIDIDHLFDFGGDC